MKLENNWKNKSLENLEKDVWSEPKHSSHLVTTCHQLRKKLLKDFAIEDLRIMIGQNIGLNFLIPLAFETLKQNILAEGDFHKGDLLKSVLTSEVDYWKTNKENWSLIVNLYKEKRDELNNNDIFDSFKDFERING